MKAVSLIEFLEELEKEGLEVSIKEAVKNEPYQSFVLRFLESCEYDAIFAKETIKKHLFWREKNHVASVLEFAPEDILGCPAREIASRFPFVEFGHDREGRPVQYFFAAKIDAKGIVERTSAENFLRYHIWLRELSIKRLDLHRRSNVAPPYYLAVMDLKGIRLNQANSSFYVIVKLLIDLDDWHYPGRVKKMLLINVPFFFNVVWSVIRRLAYHTIEQKVHIVGSSKSDIRSALLKYIPEEQVPVDYGGAGPRISSDVQEFIIEKCTPSEAIASELEETNLRSYRETESWDAGKRNSHEIVKVREDGTQRTSKQESEYTIQEFLDRLQTFEQFESLLLKERAQIRANLLKQRKRVLLIRQELCSREQASTLNEQQLYLEHNIVKLKCQSLQKEISRVREESEAHKASIRFARNFIEQESENQQRRLDQLRETYNSLKKERVALQRQLTEKYNRTQLIKIWRGMLSSR